MGEVIFKREQEGLHLQIEEACQAAQEFSRLYYETIDKKRHLLTKLYQDNAEAGWNGNILKGKEAILKFYDDLPSSEHKIESLDCQPMSGPISAGQLYIIVKTFGTVKFPNNALKSFHQSFLLTPETISGNNFWKIARDTCRFQDKSDS
ncbi:NTF2-related export protein 2-like [Dreissena polymorpha]|uniref:NTF2-related export protein 2-like n=1 Tax=Dreissena polymorpha TaxID=45954 RepID=UPI002264A059|nr:NTF2-related export protein 2-like [Dreissena polymorpha]